MLKNYETKSHYGKQGLLAKRGMKRENSRALSPPHLAKYEQSSLTRPVRASICFRRAFVACGASMSLPASTPPPASGCSDLARHSSCPSFSLRSGRRGRRDAQSERHSYVARRRRNQQRTRRPVMRPGTIAPSSMRAVAAAAYAARCNWPCTLLRRPGQ